MTRTKKSSSEKLTYPSWYGDRLPDDVKKKVVPIELNPLQICPCCTKKQDGSDVTKEEYKKYLEPRKNLYYGEYCNSCRSLMETDVSLMCSHCSFITSIISVERAKKAGFHDAKPHTCYEIYCCIGCCERLNLCHCIQQPHMILNKQIHEALGGLKDR